jgi:GYF domain 2
MKRRNGSWNKNCQLDCHQITRTMPDIYLHIDGQQTGPYQPDQVRQLVAEGKAANDTPAWYQGLSEWSTVAVVLGIVPSTPPPFVPPPVPPPPKGMSGWLIAAIILGALFVLVGPCACLAGIALGPITKGIEKAKESAAMQQTRAIALAMFAYANDHKGEYPDGKTSTEVFQKLLDEGYIADPSIFYIVSMPGKTKATSHKLTADNVCFDVTSGVTADSSEDLPVVFSTGYTVSYFSGAIPMRDTSEQPPFPGIAVAYKSNRSQILTPSSHPLEHADLDLDHFIPATFDPGTKSYQQLKP